MEQKMKKLNSGALAMCISLPMLAGCGGTPGQSAGGPGLPAMVDPRGSMVYRGSWMLPEAKSEDLLYVAGAGNYQNNIYVFTYPRFKLVGMLDSGGGKLCTDSTGNIWIPSFAASEIVEFAHGGVSPILTLSDPNERPVDCSVDPTTGNLAVTAYPATSGSVSVAVYIGARGSPQIVPVSPSMSTTSHCGYDNKGNLFVNGYAIGSKTSVFGEVRKGESKFKTIPSIHPFQPFPIQWDGKYVAVGDVSSIDRYSIHGSKAIKEGALNLKDIYWINSFWIQGSKVIVTDTFGSGFDLPAKFYAYPRGGQPIRRIPRVKDAGGVTVSLAPPLLTRRATPTTMRQ
ncbi:MAG TPA: hypothetical protein VHS56_07765 [Candidatus Cybelea sp.]|nr:hypothetical protein [Candidatus Cybelea sp.]